MLADYFAGLVPRLSGAAPTSQVFGATCAADPYFNGPSPKTALMLHMEQANGSTTPIDTSIVVKTIAATGTSTISTADAKYGTASLAVANLNTVTANGANVVNHADFNFGSGDFTIEMWCKLTSLPTAKALLFTYQGGTAPTQFWVSPAGLINCTVGTDLGSAPTASDASTFPLNAWTHVAVLRSGLQSVCMINGLFTAAANVPGSGSLVNSVGDLLLGRDVASSNTTWNGFIDEVRVTKGVARYGTNEPAPTAVFPTSSPADPHFSQVVVMSKGNGLNAGTTFVDSSSYAHTPSLTTGPTTSTGNSIFSAGSSMLVAGVGGLKYGVGAEATILTNDYTIEAWVYVTSLIGPQIFFSINSPSQGGAYLFWRMNTGGTMDFLDGQAGDRTLSISIAINSWTHIAVVRSGSVLRAFVNGAIAFQGAVTTYSVAFANSSVSVGCGDASTQPLVGNIAEFRFTNGFGRYNGSFTPASYANCDSTTSGSALPPPTPPPAPVTDPSYSLVAFLSGFGVGAGGATLVAPPNTVAPAPAPAPAGSTTVTSIGCNATVGVTLASLPVATLLSNFSSNTAISVVRNVPPGMALALIWTYPGVGPTYTGSLNLSGTPTVAGFSMIYVELVDQVTGNFLGSVNIPVNVNPALVLPTVNLNSHTFGPGARPNAAGCQFTLTRSGMLGGSGAQATYVTNEWFIGAPAVPLTTGVAGLYEFRLTLGTHTPFLGGVILLGIYGVWQNMVGGASYALQNSIAGTIAFANFVLEVRLVGTGVILGTCNITLKQRA